MKGFGGKGQLFARAANTLIPKSTTVVQFVGGSAGEYVCEALDAISIPHVDIVTPGETRTCTTLISTDSTAQYKETELVGVAPAVCANHVAAFKDEVKRILTGLSTAETSRMGLALVGTFPESKWALEKGVCGNNAAGLSDNHNASGTLHARTVGRAYIS